jgi:hypothetical protein
MDTPRKPTRPEARLERQIRDEVDEVDEVDESLLDWMLSLTPRERLRAASRASRALSRFRRVAS